MWKKYIKFDCTWARSGPETLRRLTTFLCLVALLSFVVLPAGAVMADTQGAAPTDPALVEKIKKSNDECYACHSEQGLAHLPRTDIDVQKLREFIHDPKQFDDSNHAGMECKVCHGEAYKLFPHPADAREKISLCEECHAQKSLRVEKQFAKSVHAINLSEKFTCLTCHDPHVYKVAQKIGDPRKIVAQDNAMCFDCHNSDLRYAEFAGALPKQKKRPDLDTLHEWLPNTRLHWSAVRCIECHTPVSTVKSLATSHEILAKDKAEKNCVTCHSQDTALATRLYRYAAETSGADLGFANSGILGSAYVIGATRNPGVDTVVIAVFGLLLAGLLAHGVIRILASLTRRGRKS
jgi:hypothetical protein